MNGYELTHGVINALQMAEEEAISRRHQYLDTEHLLLGLMRETDGIAAAVFRNLGIDLRETQTLIDGIITFGEPGVIPSDISYTHRAMEALKYAALSATELNREKVGTEHLLLGLLREDRGIAALVLNKAGLTGQSVRLEVLRLLEKPNPVDALRKTGPVKSISVETRFFDGTIRTRGFATPAEAVEYLKI